MKKHEHDAESASEQCELLVRHRKWGGLIRAAAVRAPANCATHEPVNCATSRRLLSVARFPSFPSFPSSSYFTTLLTEHSSVSSRTCAKRKAQSAHFDSHKNISFNFKENSFSRLRSDTRCSCSIHSFLRSCVLAFLRSCVLAFLQCCALLREA